MKDTKNSISGSLIIILTILAIFISHFYFSRTILDQFRHPKLFIQLIILTIIILLFVFSRFSSLFAIFHRRMYLILFFYIALSFISLLKAGFSQEGILYMTVITVHLLFFILLSEILAENSYYPALIMISMVIASFAVSAYSIIQILNLDPIFQITGQRAEYTQLSRYAPTGFTGNTNVFSGSLLAVIPIIFCITACACACAKWKLKIVLFIVNAVILIPLFISMTRGVVIGIIIAFIYATGKRAYRFISRSGFFSKKAGRLALLSLTVIITLIASYTLLLQYIAKDSTKREISPRELSARYRVNIYLTSLEMILDNPLFGTGPNSFSRAFTQYRHKYLEKNPHLHENTTFMALTRTFPEQAHNDILQNIVEVGIIPNIFLLLFLFLLMKKNGNHEENDYLPLIVNRIKIPKPVLVRYLKLSMILLLINAMVNFPFHYATSGLNFILTMSLLYSLIKE